VTPGDFTWDVRLRASEDGTATAYVRDQRFAVGAPLQFDSEYEHVTALECLLAALGADVANGFRSRARRKRLAIDDVEAAVSGRVNNPLTHVGVVGEEGHPGLEWASVRIYVSSDEDEQALRDVWDETLRRSPLVRTLQPTVTLDLSLKITT
jgi:uncharacterized OsmC-like protein